MKQVKLRLTLEPTMNRLVAYFCLLSLLSVNFIKAEQQDPLEVFRSDMDQWKSVLGVADDTFKRTVNDFFSKNCTSSSCQTCLLVTTASKDEYESYTWIGTITPSGPQTMYKGISSTLKSGSKDTSKLLSAPCAPGGSTLTCSAGQCCLDEGTGRYNAITAAGGDTCSPITTWNDVKSILEGGTIGEGSRIKWINYGVLYAASELMFHEGISCHNVGGRSYPCQGGSAGCVVIHPTPMKNFCENVYKKAPGAGSMYFVLDHQGSSDYSQAAAQNYVALKEKGIFCSSTPSAVSLGGPSNDGGTSSLSATGGPNTDPSLSGNQTFTSCNESSNASYTERVESVREGESPEGYVADTVGQSDEVAPPGGSAAIETAAAAAETMNKNCHLTYATESRTTGSDIKGGGKGMLGAMIGIAAVGGIGAYVLMENKKSKEEESKESEEAEKNREKEVYECKKVVRDHKAFGSQKERCQAKIDAWEEEQAVKSAQQSAFREEVQSLPEDEMMSTDSTLTVTNENDSDNTREYTHSLIAHYDESRKYEHEYGQEEKKNTEIFLSSQAQTYSENADKQATASNFQNTGTDRMTQTLDGYQNIYSQRAALLKRDLDLIPTKDSLVSNCTRNASGSGFDKTPVFDYLTAPVRPFINTKKLNFDAAKECESYVARNEGTLLTNKQIYSQANEAIQDAVNVVTGIQDIKDTLASQKLSGPELSKYLADHPVLKELGKRQLELEACSEIDCWNHPKTNTKVLLSAYGPSADAQVNYHYQELQSARANKRTIAAYNIFDDPKMAPYLQRAGFKHLGGERIARGRSFDFKDTKETRQLEEVKSSLVKEAQTNSNQLTHYQQEMTTYKGGRGEVFRDESGVLRGKSGKPITGFASPAHMDIFQLISHRYRQKFFNQGTTD